MNGWRTAVRLGAGLLTCGCARAAPGTPAGAAATASSSAISSTCASTVGVGTLRFRLTLQPAVPETTEALVRLESETERSTVRVNATLGTTFQLRPGTYRLSITLPGYASAKRSVTIACGSDTTLTVALAKKR